LRWQSNLKVFINVDSLEIVLHINPNIVFRIIV